MELGLSERQNNAEDDLLKRRQELLKKQDEVNKAIQELEDKIHSMNVTIPSQPVSQQEVSAIFFLILPCFLTNSSHL